MRTTFPGATIGAALAALCLSGCGTILNLASKDPEPYGGIKRDIELATTPRVSFTETNGKAAGGLMCFWLADLSCSAVADTLTFPFVLCREENLYHVKVSEPSYSPQYVTGATVNPESRSAAIEQSSSHTPSP